MNFLYKYNRTESISRPQDFAMADVVDEVIMDSDENEEILSKSPEEMAELKKENGNQLYKTKQYRSALPLYSEAINLCPNVAPYYGNRAACYMMLYRFTEALEDVRKSVQLDPEFVKGYIRMLKCAIAMGDTTTADFAIKKLQDLKVDQQTFANELKSVQQLKQYESDGTKAYDKKDYRLVVFCMDRCLDNAPTCYRYKIAKAECLTYLGRYQEAQEIANSILNIDKGNADAIYVRGMCLFYDDNLDSAFQHFQQVLRLAPDHTKAMNIYKRARLLKKMKEDGNEAYKTGKFQEAYNLYTEALQVDPFNKKTNAKLYFNRATVLARLTKTREAIEDCTAALQLDDTYLKALMRRAKCYMDLGEFEYAVKDYEKICKIDKSRENKKLLQDAKLALKKSKRKDYYKILGVERTAGEDEIKRAYKKRALIHHPDRHANATEDEKKEQEKKFKEVGEAYGILSDPKKKARYDSGQDMDDFDGDIDPTQVFQTFFGGGGGGHHHGGAQEFSFGNFPGSFTFQFG
ncbi:dnaJ homolog subfamily C member 7 isoform X2 [Diabrotica virgifera virgifera]|uniref:J domain-containing protein n=1 Tax=Diabrotica virgifera virgifera TaxID=50390 RepID=A0ABM5JUL0_DIAVI|nr:dnaJ homolog subfamily C member 7 isoform X2 [Diabrotica virgifera virgifera]